MFFERFPAYSFGAANFYDSIVLDHRRLRNRVGRWMPLRAVTKTSICGRCDCSGRAEFL